MRDAASRRHVYGYAWGIAVYGFGWTFSVGFDKRRERLEWCRVQHQLAAENPPLHPPTREQKADFDRACVDWYAEMVAQCDELEKSSTLNPYLRSEIEDALTCLRNGADAHHVACHLEGALAALDAEGKP